MEKQNNCAEKATNDASSSDDDDSDGTDETDQHQSSTNRSKRYIRGLFPRCNPSRVDITWPPDPQAVAYNQWRNLRKVLNPGNPRLGNRMQLYSKTRYYLAVYPTGAVRGTRDSTDLHTHLEITSAGAPGHVRILGLLTINMYVAMDDRGRVYAEEDVSNDATVFIENLQGSYNTYLSRKNAYRGWYLGIKKSGKPKRGPQTTFRQKAVQFLPDRSKFS